MSQAQPQVLLLHNDESLSRLLSYLVEKEQWLLKEVQSAEQLLAVASERKPILVFIDLMMENVDGFELLAKLNAQIPGLPVCVVTSKATIDNAVKAMHSGAYDYVTKPIDLQKVKDLFKRLDTEGKSSDAGKKTIHLQNPNIEKYSIVGKSSLIHNVFKLIGAISITPNDVPVLITGESGTGKELVARSIHRNSRHSDHPFIAVNCTAIPETLLESEIFGHEEASITDSTEKRIGKFELAKSGTVFLDEIGDLSSSLQQKLLSVLQDRDYNRLGGEESISVKARFIFSTNRDIHAMVQNGQFREDLFYRISVFDIRVPTLRERKEDIQLLVDYFINKYKQQLDKEILGFSGEVVERLLRYDFPGNVRELENLMQKAVILAKSNIITSDDVELEFDQPERPKIEFPYKETNFFQARDRMLRQFESQFMTNILRLSNGNVSAAAQTCGMTRQNLQRILSKLALSPDIFR
jgi:DNA-binding NtrC family response regulator